MNLDSIISHAKEYGFVFPSSEIYDGLNGVYDYGQNGVELRNNIKNLWWTAMTQFHNNIVGIDSSIFMHPLIWKASGHIDGFSDPMIDNKDSKKRYRADVLIEDKAMEYEKNSDLERSTLLLKNLAIFLEGKDYNNIRKLIIDENIICPISGTNNWTEVRQFNLMFSTQMGSVAEDSITIYLRPETAQGIFVNFLNVQKSGRMKIPFGICQIGKAFRNEIVARQFVFRMKEFEQMEMQFFIRPGEEQKWFEYWKNTRLKFHKAIGLPENKLKFKDHDNLAHYANAATDIQFDFPFGFKELEGIHSRTDFDLRNHELYSKKKLQYFDTEINKNYVPYVIETSVGPDRLFLAVLSEAYTEENAEEDSKKRIYLKINPALAPIKAAILPLVRKGGLPEIAKNIFDSLKLDFKIIYEDKDSIGKRYTRQDLIGTPYCVCIDYQTLEDDTVTIRFRDSMEQIRISINQLKNFLHEKTSLHQILNFL